jgi:carbamoyltransferase
MIAWGINALNHGSSLAVFDNSGLLRQFSISEDDSNLPSAFTRKALDLGAPTDIFWYEQPWVKKARQIYAGQYKTAVDMSVLPSRWIKNRRYKWVNLHYTPHHASHAAAGYYTSPFNHCAVVVLDAIGEFECATIWNCMHGEMKKVWSARYPHSLGLFYSAFTKLLGLTPIRDEFVLQQMARQGDPRRFSSTINDYLNGKTVGFNYNFHRGVQNWPDGLMTLQEQCDLAASVQEAFEIQVARVMYKATDLTRSNSLVYMGGCAMNSDANKNEVDRQFKYVWSLPNPGDASSAIGAVLYHTKQRIQRDWGPVKHIEIKV